MDVVFETAYATASGRLCLFVGTGFSKAVTEGDAPSWQALLASVCSPLENAEQLKATLFPDNGKNRLGLDECAQIISIELAKTGRSIHEDIAARIRELVPSGDYTATQEFLASASVDIVTTNYDKLVESLAGEERCHSIAPGFPVPRSIRPVNVFHVHGSTDSPGNMVVTSEDYFQFMNSESYFAKKLLTLLHENTVVVLGYSLGDTSLKAIISEYREATRSLASVGNIFFVSRAAVDQCVKDYYAYCYGIRVVDNMGVNEFFGAVLPQLGPAKEKCESTQRDIGLVLADDGTFYPDKYLTLESSFYEVLSAIAAVGRSLDDPQVLGVLQRVLDKKTELTKVNGAWEQYDHLARWLLYVGSRVDLRGTALEASYLRSALRSMENMSSELYFGYSWSAYKTWSAGWTRLTPDNQVLIGDYIKERTNWKDALRVIGAQA